MMDNGSNFSLNVYPSVEAIEEVQVLTSNYGAQYGKNGSGTVEVETKSGTNRFHGSLWEFARNEAFNAHNYFDVPGTPKAGYKSCRRSRFSQLARQIRGKSSFSINFGVSCASWRSVFCLRTLLAKGEHNGVTELRSPMSTIEEIRAAEQRVQRAVDALRNANALDPNHISDELNKATDEYARLVRELNSR